MIYSNEEQIIINKFIQKNNVNIEFIETFLNTIPDSRIKRTVNDLLCKCGECKKINKIHIAAYCGNSACWMHYGNKRPEHSKRMQYLAKNSTVLTGLFKHGRLHNKEVNTDEFKRKILEKKNIKITNLDKQYSEYQSLKNHNSKPKSYETRLKTLPDEFKSIIYQKYGLIPLTKEYFLSLDLIDRDRLFFDIHGLLTKHYDSKIRRMRGSKYKRILVKNLKYNIKVTAVICKSELEKNWIKYFEKNKMKWEYEPFVVAAKYKGSYTPDFLIEFENRKIVLEVKGTMYGYPIDYVENKLAACEEYCAKNGYEFMFKLNTKIEI